jgi:hypothetical protein
MYIPANQRPTFELRFRPEPGVDPIRAMRLLLKTALRRYGLRCVNAVAHAETTEGSSQ